MTKKERAAVLKELKELYKKAKRSGYLGKGRHKYVVKKNPFLAWLAELYLGNLVETDEIFSAILKENRDDFYEELLMDKKGNKYKNREYYRVHSGMPKSVSEELSNENEEVEYSVDKTYAGKADQRGNRHNSRGEDDGGIKDGEEYKKTISVANKKTGARRSVHTLKLTRENLTEGWRARGLSDEFKAEALEAIESGDKNVYYKETTRKYADGKICVEKSIKKTVAKDETNK
jgi:hypothetical protein